MVISYETFGRHCIADFIDVADSVLIHNEDWLRYKLERAAYVSGATVLSINSRKLNENSIAVMCLLSESHISLRTSGRNIYTDIYTCGEHVFPIRSIKYLSDIFQSRELHLKQLIRGNGEINDEE